MDSIICVVQVGGIVGTEVLQIVSVIRTSEERENKNPLNSCQTSGV